MKFFDALKMAMHNIWHNKSRTILTLFIVFIVGTLLMVLNIFALAFSENMTNVSRTIFNEKGTTYTFSEYRNYNNNGGGYDEQPPAFTKGELDLFFDKLDENSEIVDEMYSNYVYARNSSMLLSLDPTTASMNSQQLKSYYESAGSAKISIDSFNIYFTSYIIPAFAEDGFIIDGRAWNKNDRNSTGIWVSENFVEEIYKSQGKVLKAGDDISFVLESYSNNSYDARQYSTKKLTINGIIDGAKLITEQNNAPDLFVDIEFLINIVGLENLYLYNFSMSYMPSADNYDFKKVYKSIENFEKAFEGSSVRQLESNGLLAIFGSSKRFQANIVAQMSMTQMMGGFVIGFIIAISLVIVLLSVGSIANSIIISTDKNKKFIGLMKALGLKNKGVNRIINLEASIQILIGVFVSFGIMLVLKSLMLKILTIAFGSIFKMLAEGIEYTLVLSMPIYVPLAVFGVFLAFALLSARGSLRALGKMDVIAIMSEAA